MKKAVLGIDPGKDGAMVLLTEDAGIISKFVSPKIGKEIDIASYVREMAAIKQFCEDNGYQLMAFLENVHAIHGASAVSTFEFGGAAYMARTSLICHGIPHIKINPKQWQKFCWMGIRLQKSPKDNSRLAAMNLFPNEDFKDKGKRVPHDGLIDATLIAFYGLNYGKSKDM